MCFPEAYLPGLRGQDFEVLPFDQTRQERVLQAVAKWARTYAVATILGMERLTEAGRHIAAFVIDSLGQIQGYQTKNQLDPTEDQACARAYLPYGREGVLVQAIKVEEATGLLATRYAPERYKEFRME